LLANSKEQVFGEKLSSLLKWGAASTRYKDIHDLYYLGHREDFNEDLLNSYLEKWIYANDAVWLPMINAKEVGESLNSILNDDLYRKGFESSKDKWLDVNDDEVIDWLIEFFIEDTHS